MNRLSTNRVAAFIALAFLLVSCGGCYGSGGDANQDDAELVSPLVSADVATQFAEEFEHAVLIQDRESIHGFFDWEKILDEAMKNAADVDDEVRTSFRAGARLAYEERGIGAELSRLAASGGRVKLLRVREVDGRTRAIFRLTLLHGGGMNYCELVLAPTAKGMCKAIDMHSYLSGESMSNVIRRMFLAAVSDESQALLKSASDADIDSSNLQQVVQLTEASEVGDVEKVLEIYPKLPESLRNERSLMLKYLRAAAHGSEEQLNDAIDSFRSQFPEDPALDLLLVDRHLANQRYTQALACLDRIDKAVGGDPYLDVQRAGVFIVKRDLDSAREATNRAIKNEASLEHAYWMAVTISLQSRKFADTANLLDSIRERFRTKFQDDFSANAEYAEFAASPEYVAWQERNLKRELEKAEKKNGRTSPKKNASSAVESDASDKPSTESTEVGPDGRPPPGKDPQTNDESQPKDDSSHKKPMASESTEKNN